MCIRICFLSDGYKIKGHLHLPARNNPPVVIGSHGLFATQESPKQLALARACNLLGMAFFRFDHRGCGQSEGGTSEQVSFKARCKDLFRACETIRARSDTGFEIGLFGSSLGGAVVCRVSTEVQAKAVVTFAAPVSSLCIFDSIKAFGLSKKYSPDFYEKLFFDNEKALFEIRNILVIHGEQDRVVPVSEARLIFQKAKYPKKLIIQQGGDHQMTDKVHQDTFVRKTSAWFNKGFERS
jgi:alpha-beta hydrolase superfamily lysophospholipase